MPVRPAPRRSLHGHLEAPQMWREKHNALATRIGLLGHGSIDDIAIRQLAQPDARHLEHHATRMSHRSPDLRKCIASLRRIGCKSAPIGGR